MSEIDRLNREVKSLNKQIKSLKNQLNDQYQIMQTEMRKLVQDYETKFQQKSEEQSRQMKEHYNRELASLRQKIERELSQEEKAMMDKYLSLVADLEKTKESVASREQELQQLIEEYSAERIQKDQQTQQQASEYLEEMKAAMEHAEKQPYEIFYPGKMGTYKSALKNAWNLMQKGLAQAAAAVAVSVRASLERFSIDVESSQKAWEKEFDELCRYCEKLEGILKNWEQVWIDEEKSESGERYAKEVCAETDINYWTRGWYYSVKKWLQQRLECSRKIREMGIVEYLKQKDAISVEELLGEEKIVEEYLTQCPIYEKIYYDNYYNAQERQYWSAAISRFMVEEKCFEYHEEDDEIQQADVCLRQKEYFEQYNKLILENEENTDDYQGWYMMHFYGENQLRIEVCIFPVEDAQGLRNIVQFHMYQGGNEISSREVLESVKSAIQCALAGTNAKVLNTNDQREKQQVQTHPAGRLIIKEVEKRAEKKVL